ncbi:hypothetical protein K458DRAFT_410131 [Lentithecium fluviatile CBS 122367]|uniref:Ig-like domain-containing protein n=1 Tax=Lentithecium fluviatile CBS 122367 TaxID=1168545 RepID=A0A6G1IFX1_9PLEO|nr:hypothetical protein K458DRAFT_410131 [Lentithecium fluviatile CBS 122367]
MLFRNLIIGLAASTATTAALVLPDSSPPSDGTLISRGENANCDQSRKLCGAAICFNGHWSYALRDPEDVLSERKHARCANINRDRTGSVQLHKLNDDDGTWGCALYMQIAGSLNVRARYLSSRHLPPTAEILENKAPDVSGKDEELTFLLE